MAARLSHVLLPQVLFLAVLRDLLGPAKFDAQLCSLRDERENTALHHACRHGDRLLVMQWLLGQQQQQQQLVGGELCAQVHQLPPAHTPSVELLRAFSRSGWTGLHSLARQGGEVGLQLQGLQHQGPLGSIGSSSRSGSGSVGASSGEVELQGLQQQGPAAGRSGGARQGTSTRGKARGRGRGRGGRGEDGSAGESYVPEHPSQALLQRKLECLKAATYAYIRALEAAYSAHLLRSGCSAGGMADVRWVMFMKVSQPCVFQ